MTPNSATLIALVLMGACARTPPPPAPPPTLPVMGTNWIVADGEVDAPTIEFSENRAFGYGGCNRWFAQAAVDGPALTFTAIGSTKRMCEPQIMEAERAFLTHLGATTRARIEGDALILQDAAGHEVQRLTRTR